MYNINSLWIFTDNGYERKGTGQTQAVIGQSTVAAYIEVVKFCKASTRCEGNFVELTVAT